MGVDAQQMSDENIRSSGGFTSPLMIPLIGVTIALALAHFYLQYRRIAQLGNKIPGPATLPFIGNALLVINKTHNRTFLPFSAV